MVCVKQESLAGQPMNGSAIAIGQWLVINFALVRDPTTPSKAETSTTTKDPADQSRRTARTSRARRNRGDLSVANYECERDGSIVAIPVRLQRVRALIDRQGIRRARLCRRGSPIGGNDSQPVSVMVVVQAQSDRPDNICPLRLSGKKVSLLRGYAWGGCDSPVNFSGRDAQCLRVAVLVFELGRDVAGARLCALLRRSPQLGPALAPQMLEVDVVALRVGEREVQVNRQPCPVDFSRRRRLAIG